MTLVSAAPESVSGRTGVDEFAAILKLLQSKGQKAPTFAIENRRLLQLASAGRAFPVTLTTLSPSDPTIQLALIEIASLLPKQGQPQRRIINRSPNHASVVLWMEAGGIKALLGADLEHTAQPGEGWTAVMGCHQAASSAQMFKVPHHGSLGSDHPDVWKRMLDPDPLAVVTPFAGGRVRLPKDSDLKRLSSRTSNLYCTSPGAGKPPSRDPGIDRNLRMQLPDRGVIEGQPGHVRIRWSMKSLAAGPQVKLFNGAYHVNQN